MTDGPTATMDDLKKRRQIAGARLLLLGMDPRQHSEHGLDTLAINLQSHLTEVERRLLLHLLLRTFPADLAESVVCDAFQAAGWPTSGLLDDVTADARFWADSATAAEHRAYASACLTRMSKKDRAAVRKWLEDKDA